MPELPFRVSGRRRHTGVESFVTYSDAAWHITEAAALPATALHVGPWVDVDRSGTVSGVTANGYTLVNLAGSYDLGNGLTAYARIDNLLDRHYQDRIGFLRPGLGVFAGVSCSLARR
jgi:vitamin B12 transporter